MNDVRHDYAVAAMTMILEVIEESTGVGKHQLAEHIQRIVLESIKAYEAEVGTWGCEPSDN
jgi:hypothetical protein